MPISSLFPSKGIRNSAIGALETWYHVPERSFMIIRNIIDTLHSSSLMYAFLRRSPVALAYYVSCRIDDIEDNSLLRRGFPATHTVFRIAQTINSANMLLIKALKAAGISIAGCCCNILRYAIHVHGRAGCLMIPWLTDSR